MNNNRKISKYLPAVSVVLRLILGGVFIFASWGKILSPAYFAVAVENYGLIPASLTNLVAVILPWLELYCGVLLVSGLWYRSAAAIIAFLNIIFIFAILYAIISGLAIDCGCFGGGETVSWWRVTEDIFLLAFSLFIVRIPRSNFALDNLIRTKE
ncbi:MAG: DoxX family membrane protein [Calditrichales bacterium]|nr:MAG: DoxX family membrane protein [Calditrichales bacterium]